MDYNKLNETLNRFKTPMYVFDTGKLKKRVAYLKNNLPHDIKMCYAIKANTFIVKEIEACVDRFEVCSPGEINVCKSLDIPEDMLVISGVYKTPEIMDELIVKGSTIGIYTVESFEQLQLLSSIATKKQLKINVMLRLSSGNQFGLDESIIKEIIKNRNEYQFLEIKGIQYFSGTQKHSLKRLKRELEYVDNFLFELENEFQFKTEELEFGPGFPVFYFQNETFDEDEFLKGFSKLLNNIKYNASITLEIGRGIAASCGTYLTSVVDTKTNVNENYAILDGGIHHLVYFGQMMAMKVPFYKVLPERQNNNLKNWNLCGSLCTVNDILVKQLPVNNLKKGDVFAFENTGAYCMTEGISLFLTRELPQIIILKEDGKYISVRKPFNTDILNTPNYKKGE